ncbi:MAG: DUF4244 domain-containing protein [Acidimicrobiaceae bacterium]|nr:DUF4244 domain-containing protein [Acidimicrobiaceae bacterium]MYD06941.1 DUF4244 domain-containing protein [Acidimicrobiaceae bacterium]MYI58361.1 DUF4244 domain-containing protein [Acidimicrobiaceae bacterium]
MLFRQLVAIEIAVFTAAAKARSRLTDDRGQATAEYALVVLGAATVAMMLIAWATSTGKVSALLNKVVNSIADRVS